eukprot:CAMPEP_0182427996 /NCGR_PEP_ID=MMETSP1167-20130531/20940_1 /TAXON_ID=2988 /ORGANISM="Mallomonas Sp, Strain CCMP3275" /LENGTH=370 /DNA_ID=CAMNT_0024610611 /DNA_START=80 /DNA_END=1189 /DNA_ORIENTATION=+
MKSSFVDIPDVAKVNICRYLKAVDLVNISLSSKLNFSKSVIGQAVRIQCDEEYSSVLSGKGSIEYSPRILYVAEVKLILCAVSSPQPLSGYGYWISSSWLSNSKKYFDAVQLPDLNEKKKGPGKGKKAQLMKIRQRRGSDCLPPWPDMNAEITCPHGNLSMNKCPRAKRRVVDKSSWQVLRRFYPQGSQFKTSTTLECPVCSEIQTNAKQTELQRLEEEKRSRQGEMQGVLCALSTRKTGVPSSCIYFRGPLDEATDRHNMPLKPGIYHLAPKAWLKIWRQFIKDPSLPSLPPLDCTGLLCAAHGLVIIPPHVDEYLYHGRKHLLQGLGEYPGIMYEILSGEEWDALQSSYGSPDFSVRFSCDGIDQIQW